MDWKMRIEIEAVSLDQIKAVAKAVLTMLEKNRLSEDMHMTTRDAVADQPLWSYSIHVTEPLSARIAALREEADELERRRDG